MPQPRAKTAKRWHSSKYAQGYCMERGGYVVQKIGDEFGGENMCVLKNH
jgi:putative hemolysin